MASFQTGIRVCNNSPDIPTAGGGDADRRAIEHSRGIVGPLVGAGVKVGARMLRKVVELSVSLMARESEI